ncbi:MAG: histidinol-phosphate aminotransferase [Ktedonobacterales bacterium]|jgi:histidinol-phosphate aminotransferase|nr:MAG: histidinol-phosphate aminotransferase [Ktedonobacterales bacterium]
MADERPATTRLVAGLPATVPFVAPEAMERQRGRPFQLRLGANESTFGPSPRAVEAMRAAASEMRWYADPENYDLRAALAQHHQVSLEQIVVGSGIDDLLGLAVRAYLEPGATAVTSLGAYPTFNYHVAGYGGVLERVPYRDDANDLTALAEAARRTSARLVYLANPDNPTGSYASATALHAFRESLPDDCLLILDEAYIEFAPAEAAPPVGADDPRLLRMRTFSKAYGMAGARIGYALGTAEMMGAFEKIRLHFGVNLAAQAGALASLADADYLRGMVASVAEGRDEYTALGRELGIPTLPSATNFICFDLGDAARARSLMAALTERDVFVRMPGAPPLDRCVRVTVGMPAERAAFADALRAALAAING